MFKNMPVAEMVTLTELLEYKTGQVVSQTLAQNKHISLTLFAFPAGEGLSTHTSTGDALVQLLAGKALITIDAVEMTVAAGQSVVLPANVPHAVAAPENFKMLLTIVKPEKA